MQQAVEERLHFEGVGCATLMPERWALPPAGGVLFLCAQFGAKAARQRQSGALMC